MAAITNFFNTASGLFTLYWLDLLLGTIMVYSIIQGFRKGVVQSLVFLASWAVCFLISFLTYKITAEFIRDFTPLYDKLHVMVKERLTPEIASKSSEVMGEYLKLPKVLSNIVNDKLDTLANTLSESVTIFVINIGTFLAIVLLAKLIIVLLFNVTAAMAKLPVLRKFNKLLGIIVGIIRGIIIICVILGLMVPLTTVSKNEFFAKSLNQSRLAKEIYDKNYLLALVQNVGGEKEEKPQPESPILEEILE